MNIFKYISLNTAILLGAIVGFITGWYLPFLAPLAQVVSEVIMGLLKLISVPLIFLSVVATISGMQSIDEMKRLGRLVLKYTFSTTIVAATISLILFLIINPAQSAAVNFSGKVQSFAGYFSFLHKLIPTNIVQTFSESNVIGVMFIALCLSFAILTLPQENKTILHSFFNSIFAAFLKITQGLVYLIPLATWAFITLFLQNLAHESTQSFTNIFLYITCIMLANAIQGFIILPLFLALKKINPFIALKGMLPALTVAFFSRSSNAALPMTIKCTEDNLGVSPTVSRFTLPLCSTINMNGCAAFILITVLFVGQSNGIVFSPFEMITWIFIATIAAIGNAGVPMGCYFLAGALLTTMNVPLQILGIVLPLYALIDMFETALNVWSDSCVAAMVDKEV